MIPAGQRRPTDPVSGQYVRMKDHDHTKRFKIWQMKNGSSFHFNIVDDNDQSHSMRPQRKHDSNDDGDCDSNTANGADIDEDIDDGGKQQRKQMQQQHSSAALKTNQQYPPTK